MTFDKRERSENFRFCLPENISFIHFFCYCYTLNRDMAEKAERINARAWTFALIFTYFFLHFQCVASLPVFLIPPLLIFFHYVRLFPSLRLGLQIISPELHRGLCLLRIEQGDKLTQACFFLSAPGSLHAMNEVLFCCPLCTALDRTKLLIFNQYLVS